MQKAIKATSNRDQLLATVVVATSLFALCGCTEELAFEKKFSSDHFDYYVEVGKNFRTCGDTDQWLERYYEANAKFFDVTLPAGQKLQYHLVNTPGDPRIDFDCTPGIPCANATNIYTLRNVGQYEITLALASLVGDPPLFFQDGLAEVLGCDNTPDSINGPIHAITLYDLFESAEYERWVGSIGFDVSLQAASFVHYLIDTYGLPQFMSFYAHAPRNGTISEVEAIFAQEFGAPLEDTWRTWLRRPAPFPSDLCLRIMECDPSMPELVNGDVDLTCGPRDYDGVSRDGMYRFQIGNDGPKQIVTEAKATDPQRNSAVNFFHCSGGSMIPQIGPTGSLVYDVETKTVSLDPVRPLRRYVLDGPPGDYFAWFLGHEESVIHAETIDAPSMMRDGCAPAAEPLLIDENEEILLSSRMTGRTCSGFWCPGYGWDVKIGPKGGAIVLAPYFRDGRTLYSPNKVYLCSDPCPTNSNQCEMLEFHVEVGPSVQSTQVFAPGTVVHVGAPLAPYEEYFFMRMYVIPQ